jgi:chemotaxis protein MotB
MKKLLLGLSFVALAASACVSKGKYDGIVAQLKTCQADGESCRTERDERGKRITGLEGELATEKTNHGKTTDAKVKAEKDIEEMRASLGATKQELETLRKQNAETEKRLAAFRELTRKFDDMIRSKKVKVTIRRGQMIVELPAGILFASGKSDLSPEGQIAIADVAKILAELTDRKLLIAGHTDNIPVPRGGRFKDNWELSTARAVTVTKFLIQNNVQPTNLAAAGYGEFDAIGDNNTEDGRQSNRRIEIVLLPNIEELPAIPTT